ncbi:MULTISPECIES: gamma-glutamyl-gamma-aminobutyrate hydrolase family protein [unclassified Granulicatella]|uniref:gamma-glutamyl-gamma-aminobutyrate hydrolase family protein n=1 Tax=unclassified Granulicatella TaxID=2630493 RepID=UPI0010749962|nr:MULTISPECIES: gamma-glutamyl-gamma-aminobutyrate hydrolase family protein [unclassified Granulicatella]MBF0780535.1 gamma-glutamyl-gamma-aminobutyrate hydrolase family protein [Granulicatella sp. 19428wC4_WM01]TFU94940.1 gamma-glutamyl-gamma-aminobutyrate hydrolase family protein [Granulicatella sp. WM01]
MKPIIGIAANIMLHPIEALKNTQVAYTPYDFVTGIANCGGVPMIIPITDCQHIKTYVNSIHGLILAGGQDISPLLYSEEPRPELNETMPLRDQFEIALIHETLKQKKPIFGICRGLQIINVAKGGTLYQDLNSQLHVNIKHIQDTLPHFTEHSINTTENSIIRRLVGEKSFVNTLHHQAIKDLAPSLKATAFSPDGLIEAIESEDETQYILAVQWHPEILLESQHTESIALFSEFVKQCQQHILT